MTNLFVQENWQGREGEKHFGMGESGVYETPFTTRGKLFRSCQRNLGRCTGKVYIDQADGTAKEIGWVFEKEREYENSTRRYIAETWVTIHTRPPSLVHHYA